jgi:hypothetical protein
MATRCFIGYEKDDGTVRYSYCHSDGYVERPGVGFQLQALSHEQIRKFVDDGDMSCMGMPYAERNEPWDDVKPKVVEKRSLYMKAINTGDMWVEYGYLLTKDGELKWASPGTACRWIDLAG